MSHSEQRDNLDQITSEDDALGRVTHLDYDENGYLIQVTDPFERQIWV